MKYRLKLKIAYWICCFLFFGIKSACAGQVTLPKPSYSSGDSLVASDLEDNFNNLATEVNNNDERISANTGLLATHSGQIADNEVAIDNNQNLINSHVHPSNLGATFTELNGSLTLTESTVYSDVLSLTANIPTSGVLIVNASGTLEFDSTVKASMECEIFREISMNEVGGSSITTGNIDTRYKNLAITRGFDIDTSGPITLKLVCRSVLNRANIVYPRMTAMFFPIKL